MLTERQHLNKQQTRTFILVLMIAIAGTIGTFWYLGTSKPSDNLQGEETAFSNIVFHSLYPGTYFVSDIQNEAPPEKVPVSMMVYSKKQMSESDILQVASDLGVSGEAVNESGWIYIREEPYAFSSQPGGRVITYDDETSIPGFYPEYIDSHLPSDNEVKKIAEEFLSGHHIEPEGMKFVGTNHDIGYHIDKDQWTKSSESINVIYRHFINGSEIFNEKLSLEVTINKTVRSMFLKWTHYQPYREYTIITPEQAVDCLQKTGLAVPEGIQNPEKATVRNISLGYLGETHSKDLDYLIPVYKIEGEIYGENKTAEFLQYIPATPEFAAEITGDDEE